MYRVIYITIRCQCMYTYTRGRTYVLQTTTYLRTIVPLDIPIHISAPMHHFLSHPMQYIIYLLYSCVRILSRTIYKTYIIIKYTTIIIHGYPTKSYIDGSSDLKIKRNTYFVFYYYKLFRRGMV